MASRIFLMVASSLVCVVGVELEEGNENPFEEEDPNNGLAGVEGADPNPNEGMLEDEDEELLENPGNFAIGVV
ncbi:unnamed protein product [Amaranthus hypochondriacus]